MAEETVCHHYSSSFSDDDTFQIVQLSASLGKKDRWSEMPSDDCEPDTAIPTDSTVYNGVPPYYDQCPEIYVPLKDYKYVHCNLNLTGPDSPCELLKELHRAKEFRTYFLAILPVILSVFALILNAVYLGLVIRIYRNSGSSQRKRYIFLISRSGSSLMALVLFYVVLIYWKADNSFHYSIVTLFIIGGGLNFLSIAGTYIALTCLLYTAVVYPIVYKIKVTMRHCYALVALIWFLSIAASICIGLWGATLFYPCSAPMSCNYSTCQKPFAIGIVVCLSICYATVLILYSFLLFRLHTRYKKEGQKLTTNSTVDRQRSSMVAMNRLGMNMGTFAVGSIPILIVCIVALSNLQDLTFLGLGTKDPCKTYLYSKLFVEVEILASVAALVWILAMILDPVINTIADKKISGMLRDDYKGVRKRVRSWRRSSETKTTVIEPEDAHEENRNSST